MRRRRKEGLVDRASPHQGVGIVGEDRLGAIFRVRRPAEQRRVSARFRTSPARPLYGLTGKEMRLEFDAFHVAAAKTGGADNGAPGLRPDYGTDYYAAFVVDPDGYRIEAYFGG